jgi:hypothetical protein
MCNLVVGCSNQLVEKIGTKLFQFCSIYMFIFFMWMQHENSALINVTTLLTLYFEPILFHFSQRISNVHVMGWLQVKYKSQHDCLYFHNPI